MRQQSLRLVFRVIKTIVQSKNPMQTTSCFLIPQNKTMALSKRQNGAPITIITATTQTNTIKPIGSSKENQMKKVEHLLITDKLKQKH